MHACMCPGNRCVGVQAAGDLPVLELTLLLRSQPQAARCSVQSPEQSQSDWVGGMVSGKEGGPATWGQTCLCADPASHVHQP